MHLCPSLHKHHGRGKAGHVPEHTQTSALLLTVGKKFGPPLPFYFFKGLTRIQILQQDIKEHQYHEPHYTPPVEAKRMQRAWGMLPCTVLGGSICQERCSTKESPCLQDCGNLCTKKYPLYTISCSHFPEFSLLNHSREL